MNYQQNCIMCSLVHSHSNDRHYETVAKTCRLLYDILTVVRSDSGNNWPRTLPDEVTLYAEEADINADERSEKRSEDIRGIWSKTLSKD